MDSAEQFAIHNLSEEFNFYFLLIVPSDCCVVFWFFLFFFPTALHYSSIAGDFTYIYINICIDKLSKDFSEEVLVGLSVSVLMSELNRVSLVLQFTIGGTCNNHWIAMHINFGICVHLEKFCGMNVYCCCYYCLFYNSRRSSIVPGLLVDTEGCKTTEGTSLYIWRMHLYQRCHYILSVWYFFLNWILNSSSRTSFSICRALCEINTA